MPTLGRRLEKAFDLALRGIAVVLAVSITLSGLHDVSQGYDVWYYHLPFAARLVGIVGPDTYVFSPDNQARFEGFPLLGELLQGCLWRLTGHVQGANLVSVGALLALPFFLWRRFGAPASVALIAFLGIPLVQIHATSSYVDLPANAFATMLLLDVYRVFVAKEPPTQGQLAWSALFAACAVNMKFQLVPIVVVSALALAFAALRTWDARRALVLAVAIPVVFATPIKNAIVHGNPAWPVELRLLGHELPHAEDAYGSSPRHLEKTSRPLRFARSVLERDNRPIATHRRWSLDQWTPPDESGYRMGGFFGAYVALNLLALGFAAWRRRSRDAIVAAVVVAGATCVAAVGPQSHELRYYMFWMLLLVSLNLVLWARHVRWATGVTALSAMIVVAWSTEGGYLYPSGMTFDELLAKRVDRSLVDSVSTNARLCVAKQPFTFLYAPEFHPGAHYTVQESTQCTH